MKKLLSNPDIPLAFILFLRSSSFAVAKLGLESIDTFNLLALRFLIAFILIIPFYMRRLMKAKKSALVSGIMIGTVFFAVMSLEVGALNFTSSSNVALLENLAIIMVPLLESAMFKREMGRNTLFGCILALIGAVLVTFQGGRIQLGIGEIMSFGAALFYALAIILTDRKSKNQDAMTIGIVQVGTMGILGLLFSLVFENPRLPESTEEMFLVMTLAVVCSLFGFTLQPAAQKRTSASHAGMLCALTPAFSVMFSRLILDEKITAMKGMGIILILASVVLINIFEEKTDNKNNSPDPVLP